MIRIAGAVPNETAGTALFLSASSAGALTATEPSTSGQISKPVAIVTTANTEMILVVYRGETISTGVTNWDVNGLELVLDADGDTTLHASTDDQIDVKISGADDFRFTANSFNILSGSTITIDSGATITNSGTANGFGSGATLTGSTNNTVTTVTGANAIVGEANLTFDGSILGVSGHVFIGETAYGASPSNGMVIKQNAAGNTNIFVLKSGDISHGLTSAALNTQSEIDDFFRIALIDGGGAIQMSVLAEDTALSAVFRMEAFGGTASTNKTNSGARGLIEFIAAEHNGSNALSNITANGSVFCVRAQVGGSIQARMMVDEDGELHLTNTTLVALSDDYDDNQLLRALYIDHADQGAKGYIRSEWDKFCQYNRQTLTDVGILPSLEPDSMIAMRQLAFVTAGATGQNHRNLLTLAKILGDKDPELLQELYAQDILPRPLDMLQEE